MKKGLDPLIGAVFVVAILVSVSVIVSSFATTLTQKETGKAVNSTKARLDCARAELYVKNITYNCSSDCSAGVAHTLRAEVVNSGSIPITINRVSMVNTTGTVVALLVAETQINASSAINITNVSTDSCTPINQTITYVEISSSDCPGNANDAFPGTDVTFLACG